MKPFILYFFILLSAVAMADDTNLEEALHTGNNIITSNMFSEVVKENPGQSVVLSAFSVMTPLAQLALASEGASHDELLNSIGLSNNSVIKEVFPLVDRKFKSIEGVELKMANKIYISLDYELNPDYAVMSRDVFHSEIAKINFEQNEDAANEINNWVEEQTNHRIKDLIHPSVLRSESPETKCRAVLVNALYFKGAWTQPFTKALTHENNFHVTQEKMVKVPMMYQKAYFKYHDSAILESQILEMPYVGHKSSMILVLPTDTNGIGALLEKLKNPSILDDEIKKLYHSDVEAYIPKFKIETTTDLKKILQKMNVKKVFNAKEAKLDKLLLGVTDLYVSDAIQKAFIEVNEEGAEAAAANAFLVAEITSFTYNPVYLFNANHPFAFFLKANDEILFNGVFYG